MKDGRTRLAHKVEHAVDLTSGALLAVTVQPADTGDTTTIFETLAVEHEIARSIGSTGIEEVVTDKGYHSAAVLVDLHEQGLRSYVSEPDRGRQRWRGKQVEQARVYANRRRLRGNRSNQLQRKRTEVGERTFAHMYETGGMRRLHLRGRTNIAKRLLVHAAGLNLSLLMRKRYGISKPRRLQELAEAISTTILRLMALSGRSRDWLGSIYQAMAILAASQRQTAHLKPG